MKKNHIVFNMIIVQIKITKTDCCHIKSKTKNDFEVHKFAIID